MENNGNGNLNNNGAVNVNPGVNSNVVTSSNPGVVVTNQNVATVQNKKEKMATGYVLTIVFVVFVLLIAAVLLVFLLSGSIFNRNRVTCTKSTLESGYTHTIDRVYKFSDNSFTRVYDTHTFKYDSTYTDDMYNQEYDLIINSENGVTEYGFDTDIKKEGNSVIIDAYTVAVSIQERQDAKEQAIADGYSCK